MKKTLLSIATVVALLTLPVSQAMAAPKPTPPATNSGGQMNMSASQMASSQPMMSGWDMVKMRTTAQMRAKAARNAKLKGKPAQPVAQYSFDAAKGPDYFGTTPNYASSPLPHITWVAGGANVILPVYDPETNTLTDPATNLPVTVAASPYLADLVADPTGNTPVLDPINDIPQLDTAKVNISGGIRKFIKPLTANYIPVATPNTTLYPGSDYYVIGLKEYSQSFSPDLPPSLLRGYYQIDPNDETKTLVAPFYLGPIIVAHENRPVRIKFINQLPAGAGGNLHLPVDTTAMGAGLGPDGRTMYNQNRATLHLHGGLTPWISDGTPHQWTTPVGDTTKYPKGVSVYGVPDMPAVQTVNSDGTKKANASDGSLTFYYTNRQSARLLWYHDHAYGLTRLNVYAGEVSAYLLDPPLAKDANGQDIPGTLDPNDPQTKLQNLLPQDQIPLVIQDKAFVPEAGKANASGYFPDGQLNDQDPTWDSARWGGTGSLWFPHVYMTNQNPYDNSGASAIGRWDYGPWFWPIFGTAAGLVHGEIKNPYCDPYPTCANAPWEPPMIPGTPSTYTKRLGLAASDVSLAPEAFVDTPVVDGIAYPYMNVDPKAYRFRILNGSNDRYWNLQMYCSAYDMKVNAANAAGGALVKGPMWSSTAANAMPTNADAGEVPMVPAAKTKGFPSDWPVDGRDGGVPNPAAVVGNFVQIGTESGVLPNAVDVRNGPVGYNYNRRDIVVLNIQEHGLLLGPAERADVIYDFSKAQAAGCTNVILYNDSPTPVPAFDPRNDYYTNNPDQTDSGGTPSTLPGYGPDTRTIMQFRLNDVAATPYNDQPVRDLLPSVFAAVQNKPIVPNTAYAAAYPGDPIGKSDVYSRIQSNSITVNASQVGDVAKLNLVTPGSGYAPTAVAPTTGTPAKLVVNVGGGGRFGAAGTVQSITVQPGGGGTLYPRNVVANATTGTGVPVTVSKPNAGTAATGLASTNAAGAITRVLVRAAGTGYNPPLPSLVFSAPPTGNTAAGTASVDPATGALMAVTLTDVGNGYGNTPPTVNVTPTPPPYQVLTVTNGVVTQGPGVTAVVTATLSSNATGGTTVNLPADPKAIQELFEMDYGRMNATLGVELPFSNSQIQTTLPLGYAEPTSEFLKPSQLGTQIGTTRDGTAIWKITHNGVDTHVVHFHLMDVQIINRVGWDGAIRPPDANEMGWKDSVRMNPLEDAIVAMRPATPEMPFKIGNSIRSIDPTMPANHQMSSLDPATGNAITFSNQPVNMGWEYVWHCHLLGHEENDFMREVNFAGSPAAPTIRTTTVNNTRRTATVNWRNNANWQLTNFVVQRTTATTGTGRNAQPDWTKGTMTKSDKPALTGGLYVPWQGDTSLGTTVLKNASSWTDNLPAPGRSAYYRVRAESANGFSEWTTCVSVSVATTRGNPVTLGTCSAGGGGRPPVPPDTGAAG